MLCDLVEKKWLCCLDVDFCQVYNNCLGKYVGFLMLMCYLCVGFDYVEIDYFVQKVVWQVFEEVMGEVVLGWGIDGCLVLNFVCIVEGLVCVMVGFVVFEVGLCGQVQQWLVEVMLVYFELVVGEGCVCIVLMCVMVGKVVVKIGVEGVFVVIVFECGLGFVLKVVDGVICVLEVVIVVVLLYLGLLVVDVLVVVEYLIGLQMNWCGWVIGELCCVDGFLI